MHVNPAVSRVLMQCRRSMSFRTLYVTHPSWKGRLAGGAASASGRAHRAAGSAKKDLRFIITSSYRSSDEEICRRSIDARTAAVSGRSRRIPAAPPSFFKVAVPPPSSGSRLRRQPPGPSPRRDVRMVEARQQLRLPLEALHPCCVRHKRRGSERTDDPVVSDRDGVHDAG